MEAHCIARQGNEKQRGQPLRKRGLSELKNSRAMQRREQQRSALQSTATRYADSLSRHIELKDSTAMKCNELNRTAKHCIARKRTATRRAPWKQDDFRVERLECRALNGREMQFKAPQGNAKKRGKLLF